MQLLRWRHLITYFNPRSDKRSDCSLFLLSLSRCNFNPRSDERSDQIKDAKADKANLFQSTLRRTERLSLSYISTTILQRFQSTLRRTERPDQGRKGRQGQSISIHAPTNGATLALSFPLHAPLFQSTLRRTERRYSWHSVG